MIIEGTIEGRKMPLRHKHTTISTFLPCKGIKSSLSTPQMPLGALAVERAPQLCGKIRVKGVWLFRPVYPKENAASAAVVPAGLATPKPVLLRFSVPSYRLERISSGQLTAQGGCSNCRCWWKFAAKYRGALGAKVFALNTRDGQLQVIRTSG
jgi:hypothetical protein